MKTKLLHITVLIFTALIFGANHYGARSGFSKIDCPECKCKAFVSAPAGGQKGSCSVVYRKIVFKPPPQPKVEEGEEELAPLPARKPIPRKILFFTKENNYTIPITRCDFFVFCDSDDEATVRCAGRDFQLVTGSEMDWIPIDPEEERRLRENPTGKKCRFTCGKKVTSQCWTWTRPASFEYWNRRREPKSGTRGPMSALSMLLPPMNLSNSITAHLLPVAYHPDLPVTYSPDPIDVEEGSETITGSTMWRSIDGEVGIEKGMLIVATGDAEAHSFCSGDGVRLAGPGAVSLPACRFDVSGTWWGGYSRRRPDQQTEEPLAIKLNLRKVSGSLLGDLTTPDGVFKIVSATQVGSNLEVQAVRTVASSQQRIILRGNFTKGDMVFDGNETSPSGASYPLTGALRRLYIADNAVPPAALNQPYDFALVALSPSDEATTFRLAVGRLPRGLTLDGQSGRISGTPAELGNFNVRIVAADAAGEVFEQPLTLSVKKLLLMNRWLPDAFVGKPYGAKLQVAGGKPPYHFTGVVPKGLQLDPNTGELSGTPSSPSNSPSFDVTVRDSQNTVESLSVNLQVRGTTIITSYYLPEATQGVPYRAQFQVVGNTSPVNWSITRLGSIGLTINPQTGELSGMPTRAGYFPFAVQAQASDAHTRSFALIVKPSTGGPDAVKAPPGATKINWSESPGGHRGQNGQRSTYLCPPSGRHFYIYGSDVYTDDSSICTAAVHSGLITFESGGTVTVEIRPGQSSYASTTRNGVTTRSYGAYQGSYVFVR